MLLIVIAGLPKSRNRANPFLEEWKSTAEEVGKLYPEVGGRDSGGDNGDGEGVSSRVEGLRLRMSNDSRSSRGNCSQGP